MGTKPNKKTKQNRGDQMSKKYVHSCKRCYFVWKGKKWVTHCPRCNHCFNSSGLHKIRNIINGEKRHPKAEVIK
jgi:PHP family Zn ribbon phosphoesterase